MTTFKITVVFGQLKLIIPCNPDDCVRDLIEKSCIRYKKATKKPSLYQVAISHLQTQKDGAILDDDDLLRDVLDDREQVIAVYEERASYLDGGGGGGGGGAPANESPYQNGKETAAVTTKNNNTKNGDATSHTVPVVDVKARQLNGASHHLAVSSENLQRDEKRVAIVVHESDFCNSKIGGLVVRRGSDSHLKVEAAVLAPLPNGRVSPSGDASPLPPGLLDNEAKVSNHRRWSLTAPPSPPLPVQTPVQKRDQDRKSVSPLPPHTFQRDGPARRSAVTDAERWLQTQVDKPNVAVRRSISESSSSVSSRSSSPASLSPLPQQSGSDRIRVCMTTGEQFETVRLKQEPGALGIHVIPRVLQQNKLHMGLYLQAVEPQGRVGRAGLLSPGDCIISVNGVSLLEMPFANAQETFRRELQRQSEFLELDVVRKNYAAVLTAPDEHPPQKATASSQPVVSVEPATQQQHQQLSVVTDETVKQSQLQQQQQHLLTTAVSEASQSKSSIKPSALTASGRKIRKRVEISLVKGSEGLGFTLASRDNETNPNDRQVVVKQIQAKGVAAVDGRLRAGDRIVEINGRPINDLSQPQTVSILKSVGEGMSVTLVVTRLVDVCEVEAAKATTKSAPVSPQSASAEGAPGGEAASSLAVPATSLRQYLTYDIQLNDTGSAGLGVSLKASSKTTAQNLTHDLGIFIMKIIHGGAAHKDGRLKPNDQLVEVNGVSLLGKTNADAMDTLKQAILVPGPRPGFIRIRVARACRSETAEDQAAPNAVENEQPAESGDIQRVSVTDSEAAADTFVREAPHRQSMSEKRHNVYLDPRGTDAYRRFLELQQTEPAAVQPPRPKSVEPDARVVSPTQRPTSPPRIQKPTWVAGPQPQPKPQQPSTVVMVTSNAAPRRSTSLESVTGQAQLAQTVVLPPPAHRVIHPMSIQTPPVDSSSSTPPPGTSPFTRKSSLNQSFRSAVDRSAPAQINEGFEDNSRSPERRPPPPGPQYAPVATPPYAPQRPPAAPVTAPAQGQNTGLKGFFRLGKSRDQGGDTADTHHRQRFYDIERAKQQKLLMDQQQANRPSVSSLQSMSSTHTGGGFQHSPEYQRLPVQAAASPPRQYQNAGIRQPPTYYQHQQMVQQHHQQNNLLQPVGRPVHQGTYQSMVIPRQPVAQPSSASLTQHIPPVAMVPNGTQLQRQPEVIYARPQVRPQQFTSTMATSFPTQPGQPVMGVNSVQSRYPQAEYMATNGPSHYRMVNYGAAPQQPIGQHQFSAYGNGSIIRPIYGAGLVAPQQSQQHATAYQVQPSPTARV